MSYGDRGLGLKGGMQVQVQVQVSLYRTLSPEVLEGLVHAWGVGRLATDCVRQAAHQHQPKTGAVLQTGLSATFRPPRRVIVMTFSCVSATFQLRFSYRAPAPAQDRPVAALVHTSHTQVDPASYAMAIRTFKTETTLAPQVGVDGVWTGACRWGVEGLCGGVQPDRLPKPLELIHNQSCTARYLCSMPLL